MGSSHKNHAPFALLRSLALLGIIAIIVIVAGRAKSQLLQTSINYADNSSRIINIRFGEHPDKTRMVIDIQHPTNLSYSTSRNGKTIYLNLPTATWHNSKAFPDPNITGEIINFRHSPLLEGTKFTLESNTPIIVKAPYFLPPDGKSGHRIVIDFMTATVPIIQESTQNLVTTLDNVGALPDPNIHIAQLSHHQNPYIRRAFPRSNMKQKKLNPAVLIPKRNQIPSRSKKPKPNPKMQPTYQSPYKTEDLGKQQRPLVFNNLYVRGSVGMQLLDETSNDGGSGIYDQEWDPGFILSSAIGTNLEDGFRAEGEFFYSNSSLKQMSGMWNSKLYNTERVQGDISSVAIMGNIVYDFKRNSSRLTPYGMGGLGMTLLSLNDLKALKETTANDMDLVAALQVGAGFTLDLDRRTKIDIGYRYFETQNPEFSDSTGVPYESVFASHNFLLGARVELN